MRDDLPLKLALTCGLTAASTAVIFVASPISIPLFLVAGGALENFLQHPLAQSAISRRVRRFRPMPGIHRCQRL